jgi:hypothetical protein
VRRALEVVRRAGGHLIHEHLFGDRAAEQHRDHVQHVLAVHAVAILLRQLHRHAERTAARDDRDLVHRIGLRQQLATIAWPDSWYAVLRRSSSGITIERRSAPIMILSFAISKSSMSTRRLFLRAANSAPR